MTSHGHSGPSCNCQEIFEALSEYLDGEVDARLCEVIERHMNDCAPCRDFLESLKRTVALISDLPVAELPEETRRRICEVYRKGRRGA